MYKERRSLNYLGKYQDAIKCADYALKIKVNNAFALSTKAESLNYLGRAKEALYFVNKALNSPHTDCDDEYDECHTLFVKCYSLQYIGKYRAALRQIKRAIDICEDNKAKVREEDSAVDLWITKGIILNQLDVLMKQIKVLTTR